MATLAVSGEQNGVEEDQRRRTPDSQGLTLPQTRDLLASARAQPMGAPTLLSLLGGERQSPGGSAALPRSVPFLSTAIQWWSALIEGRVSKRPLLKKSKDFLNIYTCFLSICSSLCGEQVGVLGVSAGSLQARPPGPLLSLGPS